MKKILTFFLAWCGAVALAQNRGSVTLTWSDKTDAVYGERKINIPQFNPENFDYNGSKKEIQYWLRIPLTAAIDENSLQITDVVFESITAAQLGELSVAAIPNKIVAKINNRQSRDKFSAVLSLTPIIKDGTGYKKVKSFTYSFNASTARVLTPNTPNIISNSVLASGEWYRFYVVQSGVYLINKVFLQQLGINPNIIDPRKIKIYGNGGRMVPLANSIPYPEDLTENAIQVSGESDGFFHDNDYVLFYAEGVDNWNEESQTHNNLYSDKSYYYINVQGADGKRIQPMLQPSGTGTPVTMFDDRAFHEKDLVNLVRLGRRWFGEEFDINNEQQFTFSIPNIVTTEPTNLSVYTGGVSLAVTNFAVAVNSQSAGNIPLNATTDAMHATFGTLNTAITAAENLTVKLTYNNNGVPNSKGYLDYIVINSKRFLRGYGKQFRFQYNQSASSIGIGEYQLSSAGNIGQVWDITDIYNATKAENTGQQNFSFKADFGELRKYVAIDFNDLYLPLLDTQSRVFNQNLKGNIFKNAQGQMQDVDYLIVSPAIFTPQAERLANFHRNYSGLNVKVVSLESIYQEFSSGKQDIGAIRNFVKYVYHNAPNGSKVKYLNLFGDASFDFKNRVSIFSNWVPIYHALYSYTSDREAFCSDDFFGLMDDSEGYVDANQGEADIAVGRMIVSSNQQADEMVNKVIDYYDLRSYGNWRNNYVCIADDPSPDTGDNQLQFRQNKLADRITQEKPFINATKILTDSYQQITSSGGFRYPKARQDIFNAFERGALVFNYLGHGGEDGLAQERIFEKNDGQSMNNRFKYPLFVTITCEFSRFDNPFRPTAGEYTYLNPRGGAISMITTVRAILQGTGQTFNDILAQYLFSYGSNEYVSIAEALRQAKNASNQQTSIVFYLGDPALMLAIPKPNIRLTEVNDVPITGAIDDLKALSYVKLEGEVVDEAGNPMPTYNGELAVQIFDKQITRTTLRNDNADALTDSGTAPVMPFVTLGETIFRGNASVTNGAFEFGFVVPRDITINVAPGRASFYGKRGQVLLDKTGYDTTIKVGGINENAPADNIGPTVRLYMNDTNFVSGGITNQNPLFLAFLEDENGINTASGIGHDIVAILDGDESNPYKLNDYYETELDNYKKGKVNYPFRNLALGLHTIKFMAWDVYNNLVTAEITFIVVGDDSITISNVLNYPNPFVNYTQFWFTHNKPFEPLEVQVQVLTITGKVVWTRNQTVTTDGFLSREITWDGKDDFGDKVGKGVYVYKLTVKSMVTNTKTHKYEKLVIL
ncbi:type IX secretion system sortase PorU [Flavobacterium caeni]|uniref:Peptidase family C25 n=1 Tax=Flavobacterium caeni TaxID=490189 RepID=A0A1G5K0P3_9FLAO|nr:type IX secretion system sortase PorU [Flavobacterium caeni]SCY93439.1 Peptidase family C25 [Flavobacterium caeni]